MLRRRKLTDSSWGAGFASYHTLFTLVGSGCVKNYKRRTLMGKTCARGFAVSLAVLLLASAVLAQDEKCEPNTCISKVLDVPELSTGL